MGILSWLFGGSDGGSRKRYRQESGRYGKRGQFRRPRNGDVVGRGKDGRYKK